MDSLLIKGATPLSGEVRVSGAKNACLPMFAAALLTDEKCVLKNVPNLSDVRFMADIVRAVGAEVSNPSEGVWEICAKNLSHNAREHLPAGPPLRAHEKGGSVAPRGLRNRSAPG